jgi:tetratricopeptide (TPR) repeat protein
VIVRDDELAGYSLAGRYDLLALLGTGGMGSVYRARDRELDEEVALKVIRSELASQPAILERFRREVKLARRVTHRNVARTFQLEHDGNIVFCTMELVLGEPVSRRLERRGRLPVPEAVGIVRELCAGLAAAHAVGVIHRDIKPDNVLVASDGRVVLADFGVAAGNLREGGEVVGTPAYMAPEQASGEPATPASDVYAVGLMLYELVTGTRAFDGPTQGIFYAKHETPNLVLDGFGRDVAEVIARATAREPKDRLADAAALGRTLGELAHAPTGAPPEAHADGYVTRTVVVLPPKSSERDAHLALAVHEEVLARLGKAPRLRALARVLATDEPADAVLELETSDGLVASIARPAAATVTLTLPLTVGELDVTADMIARATIAAVEQDQAALPPAAGSAIEMMLRARALIQRTFAHLDEATKLLERANELHPGNPRIAAGLAMCEVRAAFFRPGAETQRIDRARELVQLALAAGPQLAESHIAAGHLELHVGDPGHAARHFRQAISRAPHVAESHEYMGRMLLEAGFLDLGLARIDSALALSPTMGTVRWDVARAWALEGRYDDCERLIADLVASGLDRWMSRARFALWRRDVETLVALGSQRGGGTHPMLDLVTGIGHTILADSYREQRDDYIARAMAHTTSRRQGAFAAQLIAEVAGYFGDRDTCLAMIDRAAATSAFDLHWLDRCPLLAIARGTTEFAALRERFARRANAILDALFSDAPSPDRLETEVW